MNEYEKKFLAWLEKERKEEGLRAVRYATVHGDKGLADEEFFKEAVEMNEAEAVPVDGIEDFPRFNLKDILK